MAALSHTDFVSLCCRQCPTARISDHSIVERSCRERHARRTLVCAFMRKLTCSRLCRTLPSLYQAVSRQPGVPILFDSVLPFRPRSGLSPVIITPGRTHGTGGKSTNFERNLAASRALRPPNPGPFPGDGLRRFDSKSRPKKIERIALYRRSKRTSHVCIH